MLKEALTDLLVGLFVIVLCGCGGEVPADSRSPQELVDSASVSLTPDTTGVFTLPAPISTVDVTAKSDTRGVTVSADVENAQARDSHGNWVPLTSEYPSMVDMLQGPQSLKVHVYARVPLQFKLSYRPSMTVDGQVFVGPAVSRLYCVGD